MFCLRLTYVLFALDIYLTIGKWLFNGIKLSTLMRILA